jgi:hypothetical protein
MLHALPEPLLRVIGYARNAYALATVDDMRDPLDVLLQREDQHHLRRSRRRGRAGDGRR